MGVYEQNGACLVEADCDPTLADLNGETALTCACESIIIMARVVLALIATQKCNLDAADKHERTPLGHGLGFIALKLIALGCDPNLANNSGKTALDLDIARSNALVDVMEMMC